MLDRGSARLYRNTPEPASEPNHVWRERQIIIARSLRSKGRVGSSGVDDIAHRNSYQSGGVTVSVARRCARTHGAR